MEIPDYTNKMIYVLYGAGCIGTVLVEQEALLEP
jgi:hypothetical protein